MFIYTDIRSDSGGLSISAFMEEDGAYESPVLSFKDRKTGDIIDIWDNDEYLIQDLWDHLNTVELIDKEIEDNLKDFLTKSHSNKTELKLMLEKARDLGFFENTNK